MPNGRYLLVTDITLTPDRLTTVDTPHKIILRDVAPNNSVTADLRFETFRSETVSVSYATPFLILESGHRLSAKHLSLVDSFGMNVYISGVLVTNVTYMPSIIRN